MSRFTDALDAASAAIHADAKNRAARESVTYMKDRIREEALGFDTARPGALKVLEFCKNCKVKVSKPKVIRGLKHSHMTMMGRTIKPQVLLVTAEMNLRVESLRDIDTQEVAYDWTVGTHGTEFIRPKIPSLGHKITSHNLQLPINLQSYMTEVVDAFLEEASDNWQEVTDKIRAHWKDVESRLEEIVLAHFAKKGPKERQIFQEKFAAVLAQTTGLIDVPADAILAVFKLGCQEIETLAKFVRKNDADVDLVELEDIVLAQNTGRVKTVMEC